MPRPSPAPSRRVAVAAVSLVAALAAAPLAAQAVPAPAPQDSSMEGGLRMREDEAAFRSTLDAFVVAAAAGDTARTAAMISPRMRAQAGAEAVTRVVATQVLPFFADHREVGRSVTITQTTDQFGSTGYAYYGYSVPRSGEPRPFVLYVVREGGPVVVANVLVNRYVEGRHR